ncbi:nuclear transport factor 2 family protein [uncultured Mucilaginibacter sp.]|uniref:nuclear transport factor 2 family protein n=1 Tax=uncultured Mucilaginibacter sp. TaxID=797541 RepID=UPI0026374D47|nr:nuclear transport factor 2 family protein [uncultured Mucilaginibacter sp.]
MKNENKQTIQNPLGLAVELEGLRKEAMIKNSVDLLCPLLSESLYYGHSSGYGDDKETFLQNVNDKTYDYYDISLNIEKAVPIGLDGLAINGKVKLVVDAEGNEKTMNSVYVAVWRNEDDVWRLLSHQTALQKQN